MKLSRTVPCGDCAFRVTAKPGWTGNSTPEEFITRVEGTDGDEPCHMAVDYSDPDWLAKLGDKPYCAGALAYLANTMKTPRDPERAELVRMVGKKITVFTWPWEFLSHHYQRVINPEQSREMMREAHNKAVLDAEAAGLYDEP